MWIARDSEDLLRRAAASRPAVVVTGARQVGKSSLVRRAFPEHAYVSLDLPSDAAQAELDPALFLAEHPPPVIVDEVQYAPGLFRHLKRAIDEDRRARGRFILTGSQKFELMREVSDSLAGRIALIELATLSTNEIERASPKGGLLEAVQRGGFPELYDDPEIDVRMFFRSYVAGYLERDVRQLLNVVQLRDFERFVRACAFRSAQVLNKSELARDVGISPSTANEWLSVLVASNQVALLEPWFSNKTKSLTKSPKLYLRDTGLLAYLLNIASVNDMIRSPLVGAIWETFVFNELHKRLELDQEASSLFFFRDRSSEVDFLLHRAGRFRLWDAKWTELPQKGDLASLRAVRERLGVEVVDHAGVLCRAPSRFPLGDGFHAEDIRALWTSV